MAVLNPGESSLLISTWNFAGGENLDVPEERKITAQQAFEMWQQKEKNLDRAHKLKATLAERKGEKGPASVEPASHGGASCISPKSDGRGGGYDGK